MAAVVVLGKRERSVGRPFKEFLKGLNANIMQ